MALTNNEVFLVSKGEYSDLQLVGIFSTREKAEKFIADNPGDDREWSSDHYNEIEVWIVDNEVIDG